MSYTNPEDMYKDILARVRKVRRKAWARLWQVPLTMALGYLPSQPDNDMEESLTPYGPLWHPTTMYTPQTVFAYTKNGDVIDSFTRVTDGFAPITISPEKIINEYMRAKQEFLITQSKLLGRLCDSVISPDQPQQCITIELRFANPVHRQYEINDILTYIDYPQGYIPVVPYVMLFTGVMSWRYLSKEDVPKDWYEETNEQPYFNIESIRGRMAIKARDANGNEGLVADIGFMFRVDNYLDIPVRLTVPTVTDIVVEPHTTIILVQSNTWSALYRAQL